MYLEDSLLIYIKIIICIFLDIVFLVIKKLFYKMYSNNLFNKVFNIEKIEINELLVRRDWEVMVYLYL